MIEVLGDAFQLIATWESILMLVIGVLVGVVFGAIPGISVTMAVALVLPFTFVLEPVAGILLLLGVYKGGIFAGCIPAILLKTPGTPASSATILDGYPMANNGQAGKALGIALYASCTADVISNLTLILFAGWLASFAMKFGPPEFFTLIVFSLTIIAGIAGEKLFHGLLSAVMGLLLATVGLDLVYGTDRFIMGNTDLMGGLNFIVVLIGLFAIPEIVEYARRPSDENLKVQSLGKDSVTLAEFKRCFKTICRGGVIGAVLGAIPGIGAAPAAFLSYGEARRASKNRDNFGKGEMEGVAASESGNSGVAGSTLIPLLALGIPGDVVTAIIIGAFMIHGIQPGPLLFQNHADLVYALFMGLILSSFFLLIIGGASIKLFKNIADVPKSIMLPTILVLCVFGGYAVNNSIFDLLVMFTLGALGYAMLRLHLPAAPFLIAFVLGPLLEDNFRQSMLMSGGSLDVLFRSPITWVFWALTISTVFFITKTRIKDRKRMQVLAVYSQ